MNEDPSLTVEWLIISTLPFSLLANQQFKSKVYIGINAKMG